jgi:hypothetical protein
MKFFYQLTLLTGDTKYVDAFEISMYNGYFGAINTEKIENTKFPIKGECIPEALPFDSYTPLTSGIRGEGIGGFQIMSDKHYYGCCACIGAAGNGLIPKMQLLSTADGIALNLYINGKVTTTSPSGQRITLETVTDYPTNGKIDVIFHMDASEHFTLKLRNPAWSQATAIAINGASFPANDGYVSIMREWKHGDKVALTLDMRTEALRPTPYGTDILMNKVIWSEDYVVPNFDREDPLAKRHIALRRGPVMLAQENRLGYSVDDPIDVKVNADGYVDVIPTDRKTPYPCVVKVLVPLSDGTQMLVTDFASAGKKWNTESKMAVWMLTK